MIYTLLHLAFILILLIKALSSVIGIMLSSPTWANISGISSGLMVVIGVIWAAVFFGGDKLDRSPTIFKVIIPIAGLLAVIGFFIGR